MYNRSRRYSLSGSSHARPSSKRSNCSLDDLDSPTVSHLSRRRFSSGDAIRDFECIDGYRLVDDLSPGAPKIVEHISSANGDTKAERPVFQAKLTFTVLKPIPSSMLRIGLRSSSVNAVKKETFYDQDDNEDDDESLNRLTKSEMEEVFENENKIFTNISEVFPFTSFTVGEDNPFYIQNDYFIRSNLVIDFKRFNFYILDNFFDRFYSKLNGSLTNAKSGLCFEFSLDMLHFVMRENQARSLADRGLADRSHSCLSYPLQGFRMGSMANLHDFYEHGGSFTSRESGKFFWFEINYLRKYLSFKFFYKNNQRTFYKIQISFQSIKWMMIEPIESTRRRIIIDLLYVPLLFQVSRENAGTRDGRARETLNRIANMPGGDIDPNLLGLCRTYMFEFDTQRFQLTPFFNLATILKTINKKCNIYVGTVSTRNHATRLYRTAIEHITEANLPFSIFYALNALFSRSYKILDSLWPEEKFISLIAYIKEQKLHDPAVQSAVEDSIFALKNAARDNEFLDILLHFKAIYANRSQIVEGEDAEKGKGDKGNYVLIRRAILSMSHLEYVQSIPLLKSRFTTFANVDYCLRIQVVDDNNEHLNAMRRTNARNNVKEVIKDKLLCGIRMGARHYEFLGSSTSQMREHGVIFYARDDQGLQAQDIRNMAGDLSGFQYYVAKYVARLGLIFSQSMASFDVHEQHIMKICDIEGELKPSFGNNINIKNDRYCFTDGIGFVSQAVARQFLPCLQLRESQYFPSAFQIRFGGCKGMLAVFPLKDNVIAIRPSMTKYESHDPSLRILKYSYPRPVYLNRPLINILTQLGVPDHVFYDLFKDNTSLVANALLSDAAAIELIRTYSISFIPYERLMQASVPLLGEPFFRSLVHYLIQYRLKELKNKGRIRVPYENGRIAFGVVDETRQLDYGEVFFQYTVMDDDGRPTNKTQYLEGLVMVTKFPCLQPGDVRKLTAVRPKNGQLDHIKDCVVFPAKGERPHPDEMGGSDLDGDEYAIFWDTPLIFPQSNHDSMIFPYGKNLRKEAGISMYDIVDFYCDYFIHNNIGKVANNHLMFSDLHPSGLMASECHSLALEYSISLDFQKTGYYEQTSKLYHFLMRPDFMDNQAHEDVYLSKRILGQFFRHCSLIEKVMNLSQLHQTRCCVTRDNVLEDDQDKDDKLEDFNRRFILPGWQRFKAEAEEAYNEYVLRVREILDQLDIANETIVLSDVYDDKPDVSKVLITKLFAHFRDKFNQQCACNGIAKRRYKRKKKRVVVVVEDEMEHDQNGDEDDGSDDDVYSDDSDEGEEDIDTDRRHYYAKAHDRNVLISAWYAIVFDKLAYHQGYPLYGLPWLLSSEMMYLSRFIYYQTNQKKIDMLSKPQHDVFKLFSLLCPMYKEEVRLAGFHIQANMDILTNSLHYKTLKLLGHKWFAAIRNITYGQVRAQFNERHLYIDQQMVTEEGFCSRFLDNFIEQDINKFLDRLYALGEKYGGRRLHSSIRLHLLSKTFNSLMNALFTVCSESNRHISEGDVERVLLLKYVVFSHKFMTKFDNEIDGKFSKLLMSSAEDKDFGHPGSAVNVFGNEMYHKFASLVNPKLLASDSIHFYILVHPQQNSDYAALLANTKDKPIDYMVNIFDKLRFITGLVSVDIKPNTVPKLKPIIRSRSGEKSEDVDPIRMNMIYKVNGLGYPHSGTLLAIMLAHKLFVRNILNRFSFSLDL